MIFHMVGLFVVQAQRAKSSAHLLQLLDESQPLALLVDPVLPPDRRNRGSCGRVGDSLNLTRLTASGGRDCRPKQAPSARPRGMRGGRRAAVVTGWRVVTA